jgi:hypothetical protein
VKRSPLMRGLLADSRGVVFLEFLVAFIPIWTLCLCTFQLALIAHADLIVKHAADAAARSAVVVLPDDPAEYAGERKMSVGRKPPTSGGLIGTANEASYPYEVPRANEIVPALSSRLLRGVRRSRFDTIRMAAQVPLIPLASTRFRTHPDSSMRSALAGASSVAASFFLGLSGVAVTFPGAQDDLVMGPEVTVRVTYAYHCAVPLARQILCSSFDALDGKSGGAQSFLSMVRTLRGGRFWRLQQDATLMVHDAPYEYRPRGS